MKLNLIPTFQQGGAYAPPYAVYQPLPTLSQQTAPTAAASSSKKDGSSKDLTDKDLLEMLEKLDGLPSDMAVITKQLQNFYVNSSRTGLLGKANTSNIAVRYLNTLNQLKVANFNKKEYDHAYEQVSKNGGINEVAINERGQFVCMNDKGDFKLMTAEELKNSEGYVAMTNSELLARRAQDVSLANKNQLLSVVQNGIGMQVVTKQILDAIGNLGTSEDAREGFVSTRQGRIIQGFEDFEKAVQEATGNVQYDGTVNDLYKYKFLSKNQAQQAAEAMKYIYSTLAPNAKALLKAKSDLTDAGAMKLMQSLIASKLDNTQEFSLSLENDSSKAAAKIKGKTGEKDETDEKSTQLVEMVSSTSGIAQPMLIDRGDGIQMSLMGRQFNLITKAGSTEPIEDTSLSNMLTQSGIRGLVKNMNNITFGDQKVSGETLKNITYNNTGVMRVNLPINPDGSVNLGLLEATQEAERQLEALGRVPNENDYRRIYNGLGIGSLLKANGKPNEAKFGAFLVTEGYTTDALSGLKPSAFVKEYSGDQKAAAELIKQSLTTGTGKDRKRPDIDTFNILNPLDWLGNYDTIYKAAIYIPITNNRQLAARLDGQKLDYDTEAAKMEKKYAYSQEPDVYEKMANFKSVSGDSLTN
jgi:hypothetical protein|uniref:Uncharacterized protein n=1 Tax=Podoviridae sp. ctz6O13 TaxID=2827757 RepID=A0A8S5TLL0_9CAUD|nr:MAG TPA: hypothetical protein [Podoviridae sp. ctz6O13]